MNRDEVAASLDAAERSLNAGEGLAGTGFWKAVAAVKRDPSLVDPYADRIAAIDRKAFAAYALIAVGIGVGTVLMVVGTLVGLAVVFWAYQVEQPWNGLALLAGTGITLVTTHGLGHLVAGRLVGIRFTHWFIGEISRPQPGVKIDYATYLRTPARARAWMHASGALVTKTVPLLALPPAFVMDAPGWTVALLIVIWIVMTATDILWSTKSSDWKKFSREMGIARRES
jgi:hypothetical protein